MFHYLEEEDLEIPLTKTTTTTNTINNHHDHQLHRSSYPYKIPANIPTLSQVIMKKIISLVLKCVFPKPF